jgi:hypothetical protein
MIFFGDKNLPQASHVTIKEVAISTGTPARARFIIFIN